jgi:endonuclease G
VKTSDGKDYEGNVWDKGHCAPAADFNCTRETLWQTFSYLNCILQHEKLNRGAWRLLEVRERE